MPYEITQITKVLSQSVLLSLVSGYVTDTDYGSATLSRVLVHLLNRLQSSLNAAIYYRLAVLVFRCRHNMAPRP